MNIITNKPKECVGCSLWELGQGFISSEGTGAIPLLLVGESPGYNEALDSLPFRPQAQAGSILHRVLAKARIPRNSLAIWNMIGCRPIADKLSGTSFEYSAINHCRVHFDSVINKYNPKVILALGALPFKHLTGLEGHKLNISNIRGYVFKSTRYPDCLVVGTYHPSYIARGTPELIGVLMNDLLKAMWIAQGKLIEDKDFILNPFEKNFDLSTTQLRYNTNPDEEDALHFLHYLEDNPTALLTYDIETERSAGEEEDEIEEYGQTITQIQFSVNSYSGIALPYTDPFIDIAKNILKTSNNKAGHNVWDFDNPILKQHGFELNGRIDDTMWCLRGDTKIKLYDGTNKTIKEIVDNKLGITLLGAKDNKPIPVNIINWHKTEVTNQKWIRIKTNGTRFPIICTPDHKIYTDKGWRLAMDIKEGDNLLLPSYGADDVIQGILLGDGNYTKTNQLWVGHSNKQKDYATRLASYFGTSLKHSINNRGEETYYFSITCSKSWRDTFYNNGYKEFVTPFSDRALALWYMDDGYYVPLVRFSGRGKTYKYKTPKDYISGDGRAALAVSPEFLEMAEIMLDYFELRFGNDVVISSNHGNNKGGRLVIGKSTRDKFFEAVAPYIIPSMQYKLPERYKNRYNGWMETRENQWAYVEQIGESYKKGKGYDNIRYCVDVDDNTHAFFTLGGLVHNCQHHFQADIPLGLQYTASFYGFPFAWKHYYGTDLAFYGIADVTSLHYIMNELPKKLKERGMWEGYNKYVYGLKPILESISVRGLPINVEKQTAFGLEIETRKEEILLELQPFVSDLTKLNKVEGYVREPKDIQEAKMKYMIQQNDSSAIPSIEWLEANTDYVYREFHLGEVKPTKIQAELQKLGVVFKGIDNKVEKRWVKLLSFNPNSVDQISNYIKKNGHEEMARKLTVTLSKDRDKEQDDIRAKKNNVSTSKNLLKKLAEKTGNQAYKLIVEYKELGKMKGTYIDGYAKELDSNNRVHTTYTFRPASGQLSSRNPNVQNYPVHSTLAEKFKECIEAKPGHIIVSLDYRGFHNKMMGFLAMDETYLRVASLDTHSFVTGHVVGYPGMEHCLDLDDKELIIFLSEIKKKYKKLRDDQIKHVVHGINFGLSEDGCYKRYLEEFNPTPESVLVGKRKSYNAEGIAKLIESAGKKKVKEVYAIVKHLFPKLFKWQERTIVEADVKGFIQTPFGARRWFFAASDIKYNKFGTVSRVTKGIQAEKALAFPVSNNSHYHMRESMLMLEYMGLNDKFNLINMIHDSLVYEPLEDDLPLLIKEVVPVMERKSTLLKNASMPDGFWCSVDIKIGRDMKNVEEIK